MLKLVLVNLDDSSHEKVNIKFNTDTEKQGIGLSQLE
jgi:hypothetical protein